MDFIFLFVALILGAIPASIAEKKGKSFFLWWIYGSVLFVVAFLHALLLETNAKTRESSALADGGRKCPHCAEIVKAEAKVCRFCQRDIPPLEDTKTHLCETCETKIIPSNKRQCPECIAEFGELLD